MVRWHCQLQRITEELNNMAEVQEKMAQIEAMTRGMPQDG